MIKGVFKNYGVLLAIAASSYVVPLVVTPYLARTLGPRDFGFLVLSYAVATVFHVITDWGMTYTGPRTIAIAYRLGLPEVSSAASRIYTAKLLLAVSSCAGLLCIAALFSLQSRVLSQLAMISAIGVVGTAMTAAWLFQGIERLRSFAIYLSFWKFCTIPLMLSLVKGPEDVLWAAGIQSMSALMGGLSSMLLARKYGVMLKIATVRASIRELRDGMSVFLSTLAANWGPLFGGFVLASLQGPVAVANYSGAERIRAVLFSLLAQLSQAILPKVAASDQSNKRKLIRIGLIWAGCLGLAVAILTWMWSDSIIGAYLGPQYPLAAECLRIFAVAVFLGSINHAVGLQILLANGLDRQRTRGLVVAWIANIPICLFLIGRFGIIGAALAVVAAEALIFVYYVSILRALRGARNG